MITSVKRSLIKFFTHLLDTPNSYAGAALKYIKVKADETGLEFSDPPTPGPEVIINNQGEFEYYFGTGTETGTGTTMGGWNYEKMANWVEVQIPEGTTINLNNCASGGSTQSFNGNQAYVLKTSPRLHNNVSINGEDEATTIITYYTGTIATNSIGEYLHFLNTIAVINVSFTNLTLDGRGGLSTYGGTRTGLVDGGAFLFTQNCFNGNFAIDIINFNSTTGSGGAIAGDDTGSPSLLTGTFFQKLSYCKAEYGGGIYFCDGTFTANIDNCEALQFGGGAHYCDNGSHLQADNCEAYYSGGGASSCDNVYITCSNCTTDPTFSGPGGAYDCDDATMEGYWIDNVNSYNPGTDDCWTASSNLLVDNFEFGVTGTMRGPFTGGRGTPYNVVTDLGNSDTDPWV